MFNNYSSGVKDGLNRQDEMYNELVDWCVKEELTFPKDGNEQATYFVQVCWKIFIQKGVGDKSDIWNKLRKTICCIKTSNAK